MQSISSLADRFPDIPRWIEVRHQLRADDCDLTGFEDGPEPSFIIRDDDSASAFVVGRPALGAVLRAIEGDMSGGIVVPQEGTAAWLAEVLEGWVPKRIILHLLRDRGRLPVDTTGRVRFLDPSMFTRLRVPDDLLEELMVGAALSPIAATFVDGEPVSFCYAGWTSETLWDVSIDTLAEHQRKGYAALCAAHMIRHMWGEMKDPVWAALEENPASWRLALRLGFGAMDEITLFESIQKYECKIQKRVEGFQLPPGTSFAREM
jgi:hypothetical protein